MPGFGCVARKRMDKTVQSAESFNAQHLESRRQNMKRPLLLRMLPSRWRHSLYYRYYRARHGEWLPLFEKAPLALAPELSMCGLIPGCGVSGPIAFLGCYEPTLSTRLAQLSKEGGLLVDVGANMGYFSLLWVVGSPTARAIAFEASPRNISMMESNIERNGLKDRIMLVPKAVGKASGFIDFDLGPVHETGWGGIASPQSARTISVPLVRLDQELLRKNIDVLKIDVEGADTWVLYGCEQLLKEKRIGMIFFEQNRHRMQELGIQHGEAQQFLRDLDYNCQPFEGNEGEWIAFPNAR